MNGFVIFIALLTAVAAGAFIVRRVRTDDIIGALLKTLASLLFVALGLVCASDSGQVAVALPAVMAQVLCMAGDILLSANCGKKSAQEETQQESPGSDLWTYGGFGAFLAAHILFIAFLLLTGAASLFPAALLTGILGGIFICLLLRKLGVMFGAREPFCVCYAAVILCAVALAVLRALFLSGAGLSLFAIGYVLFFLSDVVLCAIMFTQGRDTPLYNGVNLVLYYSGQILMALSLLGL